MICEYHTKMSRRDFDLKKKIEFILFWRWPRKMMENLLEWFSKYIFMIWILYWKKKILNKKSIYDFNRTHFWNMMIKIAPLHLDNIVKTLFKIGGEIFDTSKYFLFWMIITNCQMFGDLRGVLHSNKNQFFSISKT